MFSKITQQQIQRFRSLKRAWYALWILTGAFVLSLFSEQIVNDRPLLLSYEGALYFPTLKFYSEETFGGSHGTEPQYKELRETPFFKAAGDWMIFPPIPYSPLRSDLNLPGNPPHAPSSLHWLGTDDSGRDVLARLIYGFRTSMAFALVLVVIEIFSGIIIGGIQGYMGGKFDIVAQRLTEIWASLPFLYVVILLGSIYGRSFGILVLVFSIFQWIGLSYYMRAEFFKLKDRAFVSAARSMGVSHFRIIFRHILPNGLSPVITLLPFSLIGSISALSALDFLGFGLPPPAPSWGEMLSQGLKNLYAPWLTIASVTALFITLLLASFIGEGVRTAFNPKETDKIR